MTRVVAADDLDLTGIFKSGNRIVMGQARGEPSILLAALSGPFAGRASAMAAIAHPDFREELDRTAHEIAKRGF